MVKKPPADAGHMGSIPELGRSPGVGNDNQRQYACLENSTDRGIWQATVHGGHKESDTTEGLSTQVHISVQDIAGDSVSLFILPILTSADLRSKS